MIKQQACAGKHAVGFPVISCKLETNAFGDAVRRSWVEFGVLGLRGFLYLTKLLRAASKVKLCFRSAHVQRGKHVVGAINVRVEGCKTVVKAFVDKALGCKMVDLVRVDLVYDLEYPGEAFHAATMQGYLVLDVVDPAHPSFWTL